MESVNKMDTDNADLSKGSWELEKCHEVIQTLTEDEIEIAARTSYAYFLSVDEISRKLHYGTDEDQTLASSPDEKDKIVIAMARRFLTVEYWNTKKASKKMKDAVRFRDDIKVDVIRRCFYVKDEDLPDDSSRELHSAYRRGITQRLSKGNYFVRGSDKKGRSLHNLIIKKDVMNDQNFNPDWYLIAHVYTLERALARAERISLKLDDSPHDYEDKDKPIQPVIVCFDYLGYTRSQNEPPVYLVKKLLFCLRDDYPELIQHILLFDAPVIFKIFYTIVRPFIDPFTKKKVKFVSGDDNKMNTIGPIVSPDQAMKFMLPGASRESDEVDMLKYLTEIPFDYDVDGY